MNYKKINFEDVEVYCNDFFKWILITKKIKINIFDINQLYIEYSNYSKNKEIENFINTIEKNIFLQSMYELFFIATDLFEYCKIDINEFTIIKKDLMNLVIKKEIIKQKLLTKIIDEFPNNPFPLKIIGMDYKILDEYMYHDFMKKNDLFIGIHNQILSKFYSDIWIKIFVSKFINEIFDETNIEFDEKDIYKNNKRKKEICSGFLDIAINSQFLPSNSKKYAILIHRMLIESIFNKEKIRKKHLDDREEVYGKLKKLIVSYSKEILKDSWKIKKLEMINFSKSESNHDSKILEIEEIDNGKLKKFFDLPLHYYFELENKDKNFIEENDYLKNIFFKICFFIDPVNFWAYVLADKMALGNDFKDKINDWFFLWIWSESMEKDFYSYFNK